MPEVLSTEHMEAQRERVRSFFDASRSWQGDFYTEGNEYFSRLLRRRRDLATELLLTVPRAVKGDGARRRMRVGGLSGTASVPRIRSDRDSIFRGR